MRHVYALAWALAVAVGAAGMLYAQTPERGSGDMPGMMAGCPMMHAMATGPAAVLAHRDTLDLTDDQVRGLETLRDQLIAVHGSGMQDMPGLHRSIEARLTDSAFDAAAVREVFERMAAMHTEMAVQMLATRFEARQLLTPRQRTMVEGLAPHGMMEMHGMGRGRMNDMHGNARRMHGMMGMSMRCPMMGEQASDGADARSTPLGEER